MEMSKQSTAVILLMKLLYNRDLKEVRMNGCGRWLDRRVKLESV